MKSAPAETHEKRLETIQGLSQSFRARASEADRHSTFPAENFADLRAHGLLALTAPERLGGIGLWAEDPPVRDRQSASRIARATRSRRESGS